MDKKISKSIWAHREFFLFIFVVSLFLCFAIQSKLTLAVGGVLLILFNLMYLNFKLDNFFVALVVFFICIPPFLSMNHGLSPFLYFVLFLFSLGAAKSISQFNFFVIYNAFFRAYIFFAVIIFIAYWFRRDLLDPFEGLIEGSSTNGITSYLVALQITLSIVCYLSKGIFPLGSAICTLAIAIVGIGRGSIYSALMILIFSIFFNFLLHLEFIRFKKLAMYFCCFLVFSCIVLLNYDLIYSYLESGTKALQGPKDSARIDIINEYVDNINWINLFTGQSFQGTLIGDKYGGNPHVAYIRTHAYMGLLVVPILLSPILIFFNKVSIRDKIFVFILISIAMFRALSEPIFFPTLLDFCYFLPFFALAAKAKIR